MNRLSSSHRSAEAPGVEVIPAGEAEAIFQIERELRKEIHSRYPPGSGHVLRDAHPKSQGCVRAEFSVCKDIPKELRVGIFQEPRTYPAFIRFSNGSPKVGHDRLHDIRGMAIKLLDVNGEKAPDGKPRPKTQDFVLANHPVMFIRNASDYVEFTTALHRGKLLGFFFGWNPTRWRLHELRTLLSALRKRVHNLLGIQYWSQTPYCLGQNVVKFSVRPCNPSSRAPSSLRGSPDYLREAMVKHLENSEACFAFLVQLQTDAASMPIEDPTIRWKESLSRYRIVARIRIPPQVFDTPEQHEFGEHLSFSPWQTLPEHRPLGGINRVRKQVYDSISELRHQMNDVPRVEPELE